MTISPALGQMVSRGYTVVAPDYPGLGSPGIHPFLVGPDTARAVLDGVRAARAIPGAYAGTRVAIWGESQGGHAALWSAQQAARYARDLTIVGVAAAAPPTDLPANLRQGSNASVRAMMTAFAAHSWSRHYGVPLTTLGRKPIQDIITRLAQNNCVDLSGKPKLGTAIGVLLLQRQLRTVDMGATPPWSGFALRNSVRPANFPMPVLIAQSPADVLVAPAVTRNFARQPCRTPTRVRFVDIPGGKHENSAADSAMTTLAWIADRFAGLSAPSDCGRL
ncbi:MAG: alpha/beta fold hydrolase [Sphingomonadales bacterium]|nr:MAG: alpha/beta fold hydrolase [Sphingomonadales bacterium]